MARVLFRGVVATPRRASLVIEPTGYLIGPAGGTDIAGGTIDTPSWNSYDVDDNPTDWRTPWARVLSITAHQIKFEVDEWSSPSGTRTWEFHITSDYAETATYTITQTDM